MHRVRIEDIISTRMWESWADSRVRLCAQRLFSFLFCCLQSTAALCSVLFIYKTNTSSTGCGSSYNSCCFQMLPQHPSRGTVPSEVLLVLEGILAACSAHSTTPARCWQVFLCPPFFSCFCFLEGTSGCIPKTCETLKIAETRRRYQIVYHLKVQLRFHE